MTLQASSTEAAMSTGAVQTDPADSAVAAEQVDAAEQIVETVRAHYAAAARAVDASPSRAAASDGCCGEPAEMSAGVLYYSPDERTDLPESAVLASLGCGNPTAVAELRPGERVLDLGSGGGIDVLLSARRVGPAGKAYGLDMTDEMLALAVRNAAETGVTNVEFLRGRIESVPLPAATIDVVISNCVINLSTNKPAVFAEMARVLRPGGRVGVADIVARDDLTAAERAERGNYAGCVAGALTFAEYEAGLRAAGFESISIEPTQEAADGMYSAIVRATKPSSVAAADAPPSAEATASVVNAAQALPTIESTCGCGPSCCG